MMVNIDELKESLNCDGEFLVHLLEKFMEESGEDVNRLKNAAGEKEWPRVKGIAHKMLSSTRIFNMQRLSDILEEIETTAEKRINVEQIPGKIDVIEELWGHIVEEIKESLNKLQLG